MIYFKPVIGLILILFMGLSSGWAAGLTQPVLVTSSDGLYKMSRNPSGNLAVDSGGTLHLAYWEGGEETTPEAPSFIYYTTWRADTGWAAPWRIDNSTTGEAPYAGQHIGGRHPSLTLTEEDTVWITWHDHRNCQGSPGNWIDNIEIYADSRIAGGTFSQGDIRLTNSSAGHLGDNGFNPKINTGPEGRVYAAWFDFHFDESFSDIFLKSSDTMEQWNLSESMADMRVTSGSEDPAFSMPDLEVTSDGAVHLVWTLGHPAEGDLYYGRVNHLGVLEEQTRLRQSASDFFDPPKIVRGLGDDLWAVWTDRLDAGGSGEIYVMRRPAGAGAFDAPQRVTNDSVSQSQPDAAVDSEGRLHLVWVDQRSGVQVYYGIYDSGEGTLVFEQQLTEASANWSRPAVALDSRGEVYVIFEKDVKEDQSDLYFSTSLHQNVTAAEGWSNYR